MCNWCTGPHTPRRGTEAARGKTVKASFFAAFAAAVALASIANPAGQQPSFRADINYVELPVRVLDTKGNFIRDLKPADVQVFEDGKLQAIATFALVDLATPTPGRAVPAPTAPVTHEPMTTSTLEKLDGRVYLFVLDDAHIRPQYSFRAKTLVHDFIRDRMGANDVGAVEFTSGIRGQDFTQDRGLLLSALGRFSGTFESDEPGALKEMKARAIVKQLGALSAALGAIKGRHKAVLLVTPSVGCAMQQQAQAELDIMPTPSGGDLSSDLSSEGSGSTADGATILCKRTVWDTVRASTRADVSIYSLDPRGLQNPGFVSPKVDGRGGPGAALGRMQTAEGANLNVFDGMHILADETGGFVVTGTNSFNKAFDRIVSENSSYYVVGYYASNDKADGSLRKNVVTVNRPGMQVLYRAAYVAPRQ
jgi:VWFA-related protein